MFLCQKVPQNQGKEKINFIKSFWSISPKIYIFCRIPQLRHDSHESITSEDDQDFPPTLNFPENLKFDFHEEISRRLYNVNSQRGPPTEKEAKRMARTLKWMGQLQSIQ